MSKPVSDSPPKAEEGTIKDYQYLIRFPKHIREVLDRAEKEGNFFDARMAEQLKNNWCAYVKVPQGHPMFGLTLRALEDSGDLWKFPLDPMELTWADHLNNDKEFWYFGWNYDRIQCYISQSGIKDDIIQAIDWVDTRRHHDA